MNSTKTERTDIQLVERERDLLRFTTAGSVDDGKSTLIGRIFYDSKQIFQDQMDALSAPASCAERSTSTSLC